MNASDTQQLTSKVTSALTQALRLPSAQVTPTLAFGDLPQWDSMGHMEVMMVLENQFGIEINAETIAALTSVPAICAYLRENGHA